MARYIDAEKLHYSRVRIAYSDGTIGGYHAVVMSAEIKDAPTADVVEVVRCKNCIHKINYKGRPMCTIYGEEVSGAWYGLNVTKDEHFCSYGERRIT